MASDTFSESSVTPKVEKPLPQIAEMTYFKHSVYGRILQEALVVFQFYSPQSLSAQLGSEGEYQGYSMGLGKHTRTKA